MTGKPLPDPGFSGDDGTADRDVIDALASGDVVRVEAALVHARVFVALKAVLGDSETDPDGLRREKTSDIAVVTVQRPDGARALPVFTSTATLAAWDDSVRPLPVEGPRAALATYAEEAVALLVDPGSAASVTLFGPLLVALAEGRRWVPPAEDPDVATAVEAEVPSGVGWSLASSEQADATLVLTYPAGTSPADAQASAERVAAALADVPILRARLTNGLDVAAELDPA